MTVATTCSVAERRPATRSGRPSGTSTRQRICHSVMPIDRAASMTRGSIASKPAYAPARIDGIASRTKVMTAASVVRRTPRSSTSRMRRPNDGMARAAPEIATAMSRPLPVWPMSQPRGTAMIAAITTERNV